MRADQDGGGRGVQARWGVIWYNALVKFVGGYPHGTYNEFVKFLLMGGGKRRNKDHDDDVDDEVGQILEDDYYDALLCENFYDGKSEYRKLWNNNLTLGLPPSMSTLEGRTFVPALAGLTGRDASASRRDDYLDTPVTLIPRKAAAVRRGIGRPWRTSG